MCVCVFQPADSVSLLVISLFKLSVSSWFYFDGLYMSRNLSISSWLSNFLVHNCSWYSLCFSFLSFFLFFFFVYLQYELLCLLFFIINRFAWLFSFLFGEPGQKFINLIYTFKEPDFDFIDFFSIFLIYFLWSLLFHFFCWFFIF